VDPSFQLAYSALAKTVAGLPGSSTLLFPTMPCSSTPPGSPATLPCRLPTVAFQEYEPVGPRIVRSHEAQSLHLRYGLIVALPTLSLLRYRCKPKARFPVDG